MLFSYEAFSHGTSITDFEIFENQSQIISVWQSYHSFFRIGIFARIPPREIYDGERSALTFKFVSSEELKANTVCVSLLFVI